MIIMLLLLLLLNSLMFFTLKARTSASVWEIKLYRFDRLCYQFLYDYPSFFPFCPRSFLCVYLDTFPYGEETSANLIYLTKQVLVTASESGF